MSQRTDVPRPCRAPGLVSGDGSAAEGPGKTPPALSSPLANWIRCVPFVLLHVAPLAVFWTGLDLRSLLVCAACYFLNMVGITAGYHRYFSHRSFKTSRVF